MKRLSIFLITIALIAGMAGCGPLPPAQEIRDWYDLDAIRDNFRTGYSYLLMNDLDSTTAGYEELASPTANGGKGWQPIGTLGDSFDGLFYGQGYEIRDLFINRPGEEYVGLFGRFVWGGIQDIGVVNFTVAGGDYVGVLVGENDGHVLNCYCTMGNVTGDSCVGSLVGCNSRGAVVNSYYNYDEVPINGQHVITVGALFDDDFEEWLVNDKFLNVNDRLSQENGYYVVNNVTDFKELLAFGQNYTLKFRLTNDLDLAGEPNFYIPYLAWEFDGNGHKISNLSFNFSFVSQVGLFGYLAPDGKVTQVGVENVNITGDENVGGLVGGNDGGTVSNSHSSGNVTGEASYVGGLVGYNVHGTVTDSYFTGSVTGDEYVGGLVGWNHYGNVCNSYSNGSVTGDEHVGGLVGHIEDTSIRPGAVSDSYSSSNVTGSGAVGGLVGFNGEGTVSNSYSTGSVTGDEHVGGLVGYDGGYYVGTVSNSFWDIETSGQSTSDGGTGKTTAQMKDITTFSGAGWNIISVADPGIRNPSYIWNIVDGQTYPFLSWEP